jgi:hypothetical protein
MIRGGGFYFKGQNRNKIKLGAIGLNARGLFPGLINKEVNNGL